MEIRKIIDMLDSFSLREINTHPEPAYIETHKMIKPQQARFFPACLYAGYVSELPAAFPRRSPANLICIDDAPIPKDFLTGRQINLYLAPAGTNQFDVLNRIADIMIDEASVVAGMRRILDVLYRGEGLQALVDTAADVLGNAMFINDPAFKILAMSNSSTFENATLELEKSLGYVHLDNVEAMRRDGVLDRHKLGPNQIYRIHRSDRNENWLFKSISLHGIKVADVAIVDNNQPFRSFHEELLDRFANVIAIELEKNDFFADDQSIAHNYFLGDLLSKKILSEHAIEQRCRIIKWKTLDWYKVLVIADRSKGLSPTRVQQLSRQIKAAIPQAKWTVAQNNFVVVVTSRSRAVIEENGRAYLSSLLDTNDLFCGLSMAFESLVDTREHYLQAYRAVDTGLQLRRTDQRLFEYEPMIPYYILHTALKRNDLSALRPESARILEEHDAQNSSELLHTLEVHLRHINDPVGAARELCIHRNTLLYRLNKIKELTGADLRDSDTRFSLQLYLKACEVL